MFYYLENDDDYFVEFEEWIVFVVGIDKVKFIFKIVCVIV